MIANYHWNMALADSLHCSLAVVEILLRNTIHNTLSAFFGRPDWYDGTGVLGKRQQADVATAKRHIARYKRDETPARVVSQLTFGFWVTILSGTYNDRLWRPNRQANLKAAFRSAPARMRRNDIQATYYRANSLRNRAFRHEPLFDQLSLPDDYHRTYEGIAWIDPAMVEKVQLFDRFPHIYHHGRAEIEQRLRELFATS